MREVFEEFKDIKETIKDKLVDIKDRKEDKLLKHLEMVGGTWSDGPLLVTVEPNIFSTLLGSSHEVGSIKNLKSPEEFKKAYPEILKPLGGGEHTPLSPLILGRIDIAAHKFDEEGVTAKRYMEEGKNLVTAGADLFRDVQTAFKKLARRIQEKDPLLSQIDYFIGFSRLGSVAGHFGFDTFSLSDDIEREHPSHKLAEESNIKAGMTEETAKKQARKRPATLVVISKKKFLQLYGE